MPCDDCQRVRGSGFFMLSMPGHGIKRLDICKSCEHYTGRFCKKCGCLMSIKVRIKSTSCPIGLWGKE